VDDNFIGNKKNVSEVLHAIKNWSGKNNFPFYFSTESSINLASNENLLQMMQDVDFRYVFIGIETPEDEILMFTNKKINVNIPVVNAVNKICSYGIIVNAGFILGFDHETDTTAGKMIQCIQDSGICMAMVGKMYALPETQLTKRLKREGRLFENGSQLSETNTELDQVSNGLNFITSRSRTNILKDHIQVIHYIYNPEHYYERVLYTSLHLNMDYKFKPGLRKLLKNLYVFLKVSIKVGFNRTTGWLYWKTLLTVIFKNPRATEATVNLAAMFIHFHKLAEFIISLTKNEVRAIERIGEETFNHYMSQRDGKPAFRRQKIPVGVTGSSL
jgi:hypothetical protein